MLLLHVFLRVKSSFFFYIISYRHSKDYMKLSFTILIPGRSGVSGDGSRNSQKKCRGVMTLKVQPASLVLVQYKSLSAGKTLLFSANGRKRSEGLKPEVWIGRFMSSVQIS